MPTKYFLYARKSTEEEERQIMSIEAQLHELGEYAAKENITIVEKFIESKSAKTPGREIFNRMIQKIYDSHEPIGIMAWHPDRLARNSVDGGQIIYLVDINKISSLKFPTFWFEPTPQGKFMLQVAFGQSKYYSDNLSENVKRGLRQKLRRGEWPTVAPLGYVSNLKTRNIEPDPVKSKIVKKSFEEYAQGKYTLEGLGQQLSFWGITSKDGKPLHKATIKGILTNKAYIGLIRYNKEIYEGNFQPIVSPATFEKVQAILKKKAKPRHKRQGHHFPFTGLLTCGECGSSITAQWAHGQGGTYRYYHCTKWRGPCSQRYLREDLLAMQLKDRLTKVALCPEKTQRMLKEVESLEKKESQTGQSIALNLARQIKIVQQKLDMLVDNLLDNIIDKPAYLTKKEELLQQKAVLIEKKEDLGRKRGNSIEPIREWINTCIHADKLASSNNFDEIKGIAEKIVMNPRLLDKKIVGDFARHFEMVLIYKEFSAGNTQRVGERLPALFAEFPESKVWWAAQDLNLQPAD